MKDQKTHKRFCFGGGKSSGKTNDIAICHAITAPKTARNLSTLPKHELFNQDLGAAKSSIKDERLCKKVLPSDAKVCVPESKSSVNTSDSDEKG